MLILGLRVRPTVATALEQALLQAEKHMEVSYLFRQTKDVKSFSRDFLIANGAVLDLATISIADALALSESLLSDHPFVRVIVVPMVQHSLEDQCRYFDLGRIGVVGIPSIADAESTDYWFTSIVGSAKFDVVVRARKELYALLPQDERGDFLRSIAEHAMVSSVKGLALRMYPDRSQSQAYKRRRLWQTCKILDLAPPEHLLVAIRLFLIKYVLDSNQWTLDRVARYFGMESARHLNRACKTRYNVSCAGLKDLPLETVRLRVASVLLAAEPEYLQL